MRKQLMTELGRIGGKACVKKHGKEYMAILAKRGADKRWKKPTGR